MEPDSVRDGSARTRKNKMKMRTRQLSALSTVYALFCLLATRPVRVVILSIKPVKDLDNLSVSAEDRRVGNYVVYTVGK